MIIITPPPTPTGANAGLTWACQQMQAIKDQVKKKKSFNSLASTCAIPDSPPCASLGSQPQIDPLIIVNPFKAYQKTCPIAPI